MSGTAEFTQVLHAIGRSEEGAAEKLLPLVYAELRRLVVSPHPQGVVSLEDFGIILAKVVRLCRINRHE